jgi:predicted MFS family arabinose efflux permease
LNPRTAVVLGLGTAQTLAWAASFYLPAMLASAMARDLGVARPMVYAALSVALVVSAFAGPLAGRLIDRHGGRRVLMVSNGMFASGLLLLASAQGPVALFVAWAVLGLAMAGGLYDAAFSALVRLYRQDARSAITGITLIAGFASTVGWPLTAWMEIAFGWRGACVGWAALHLLLGLPLNAALPRHTAAVPPQAGDAEPAALAAHAPSAPRGAAARVALLFTLSGFVGTAVATHLPALLLAAGASAAGALAAAALLGPAQVAARLFEFGVLRRLPPLVAARGAFLGHPIGAAVLLALGGLGTLPFVLLHGLGNGLLTIVRGTLPLALFGAEGYGARQGWITLPGRLAGALSPWLFGLVIERWGAASLWLTGALGCAAFALLLGLRARPDAAPRG